MDSYNFMTFSIESKILCISHFQSSLLFLATPKQIGLFDLSSSSKIASCPHRTNKKQDKNLQQKDKKTSNNSIDSNQENETQSEQEFSPIEIHFFPAQKTKQSSTTAVQSTSVVGHLIVHYKLSGLSVYKVKSTSKVKQNCNFQQTQTQNIKIQFQNYTAVTFGAAFLKLCFNQQKYVQTKNSEALFTKLLNQQKCTQTSTKLLEQKLMSISELRDFQLEKAQKTPSFYVFVNQNDIYMIKKLHFYQDVIHVEQTYQIDEQSCSLNSSTVTVLKQVSFLESQGKQRFLILAMEGGSVYLFKLPEPNRQNKPDQEFYLQPFKILDIKNYLCNKPQHEEIDYSVIGIELLHQGLGLFVVRKYGILLVDLRKFTMIKQLLVHRTNQKPHALSDSKIMALTQINIQYTHQKIMPTQTKNQAMEEQQYQMLSKFKNTSRISTSLVLSTENRLRKLFIQIIVSKKFDIHNEEYNEPILQSYVSVERVNCRNIEQLNTALIEGFVVVEVSQGSKQNNQGKKEELQENIGQTQVFGHYKEGKLFYFTP